MTAFRKRLTKELIVKFKKNSKREFKFIFKHEQYDFKNIKYYCSELGFARPPFREISRLYNDLISKSDFQNFMTKTGALHPFNSLFENISFFYDCVSISATRSGGFFKALTIKDFLYKLNLFNKKFYFFTCRLDVLLLKSNVLFNKNINQYSTELYRFIAYATTYLTLFVNIFDNNVGVSKNKGITPRVHKHYKNKFKCYINTLHRFRKSYNIYLNDTQDLNTLRLCNA